MLRILPHDSTGLRLGLMVLVLLGAHALWEMLLMSLLSTIFYCLP